MFVNTIEQAVKRIKKLSNSDEGVRQITIQSELEGSTYTTIIDVDYEKYPNSGESLVIGYKETPAEAREKANQAIEELKYICKITNVKEDKAIVERAERIVEAWNEGQLTECAYQIAVLYSSNDYRLVSSVMAEFKKRTKVTN